jgi:hypothetical protein
MQPPANCPEEIATMMQNCWQHNPNHRPSFNEIHAQMEALWKACLNQNQSQGTGEVARDVSCVATMLFEDDEEVANYENVSGTEGQYNKYPTHAPYSKSPAVQDQYSKY